LTNPSACDNIASVYATILAPLLICGDFFVVDIRRGKSCQ
jgi:hypothetical protein